MARNLELFPTSALGQLVKKLPGLLLRVDEIRFSLRTQNCLISDKVLYVGDLVQQPEKNLLRIPNFGRKSLRQVIATLNGMHLHLGTTIPNWPPEDIKFLRKQYAEELAAQKEKLYLLSHQASASCLEEYLFNIATQTSERNAEIFIQRMGWDGHGGKTLDAVGKKHDMTRERVRQICSKVEKMIRQSCPSSAFLKQAITYVNSNIPDRASVIESALVEKGICRHPFRVEGIITAAKLLSHEVEFGIEKIGRKRTRLAIPQSLIGSPKHIKQEAQRHVTHWGAGTVYDVIFKVNTKYQVAIPDSMAILTLESIEGFSWLDQESSWFWFINIKRNRIINLIRKISSVANKLSLDELRSGIMRPHRMRGYSPPKRVLREICEQSNEFRIRDNFVIADPPLRWEVVLEGTNAYDLVMALAAFGPVLTRSKFEALCLDEGMNRSSFYMYLDYSPLIQRYSRGVYGLRGANISVAAIEQLRKKVEAEGHSRALTIGKGKVLIDYGWTSKGKVWVSYKLSESSVFSGVVSTPGRMRRYLDGKFDLYSVDKKPVGTLCASKGSTWGLGPFFRRRGCEPDDFMVLLYDLKSKIVMAELGDEELTDRLEASK